MVLKFLRSHIYSHWDIHIQPKKKKIKKPNLYIPQNFFRTKGNVTFYLTFIIIVNDTFLFVIEMNFSINCQREVTYLIDLLLTTIAI